MTVFDFDSKLLIQKIRSEKTAEIIKPIKIGDTSKHNELVFFIKPELLEVEDDTKIQHSLELIQEKFNTFDIEIDGIANVPGIVLEEYGIMNRHYGFINQLSRMASSMVDPETRFRLFEALGIKDDNSHVILGGHEFIEKFNSNMDTLSEIWFGQKANKLRSGFYFIADRYNEQPFILINGFHPSQLLHFTRQDHNILLMLIHTDTDWYDLKFDLVGDTFPEKAKADSIRGTLYANPDKFGQSEVGINTNGVHLSAGPFEAAFEVVNFFGPILHLNPEMTPPLAIKSAVEAGIPKDTALSLLDNPSVDESDLFSKTENINTQEAVKLAVDWFCK